MVQSYPNGLRTEGFGHLRPAHIGALIDEHSSIRPDAVFVRWQGEPITWATFAKRRNDYARVLESQGIAVGDRVAVQCGLSPELLYLLFGIWRIGAVAVMSNTANTRRELRQAVMVTGAKLTIVDEVPAGDSDDAIGVAALLGALAPTATSGADTVTLSSGPDVDDPATVLFTSGSTAAPKCVLLRHRHHLLAGQVVVRMLSLTPDDRFLQFFPIFHMNGLGHVTGAITAGCEIILQQRYRTGDFREWIRAQRPTAMAVNATHIKMLANDSQRLRAGESSLRAVQLGLSAMLSDDLYESFEGEFGCALMESYGLTESAALCSISSGEKRRRRSCGQPTAEYELRVVDENREQVPATTLGGIEIRLPTPYGPLPSYLGDDALGVDEWVRTGDVGYIDADGFMFWVDREKELIKRAGENIAPSEVELVLESHPAVTEAVVVGLADPLREEVPWAWVVADTSKSVTAEELLDHCRTRLARFKVPEGVDFVDAFPRTGVGKIERKIVRGWPASRK